jgi:hybrid cluster-associated redox disulfide protein
VNKITREMTVEEVVEEYPNTARVFVNLRIPCLVCGEPLWTTIEETARKYNVDMDTLLAGLNNAARDTR